MSDALNDQRSLAQRRAELVRLCDQQRDQLALELLSLRHPLDGGDSGGGGLRGLLASRLQKPLMVAGAVAAAVVAWKRTRGAPLSGKLMALWGMAQPVIAMLRRSPQEP